MGRPALLNPRSETITMSLSSSEKRLTEALAADHGMTKAELGRQALITAMSLIQLGFLSLENGKLIAR